MQFDPTLILIAVVLVAFVIFQFRSSRKKAKAAAERQKQIVPGVEIMTNYGLFGTITELDDENNFAFIEISPGNVIKIHKSTILKAADDTVEPETVEELESEGGGETTIVVPEQSSSTVKEPQFGERVEPASTPETGAAKKLED
ncbi:preprotein translocase subunit YajC [Lacisediminihabitans changchengi]|uniref:Preprotein translocase subunit YajC n=1 Tax=Lacisediminihabitans changchengi TaxID=2787634 RepID=A0A934SPU9_9MICO|nr:preprotein translocase subunit YajC [Lacisediminihabitans changchengi]MBK4346760.1 preprotein translocase subunit YajC [Lacisediminihabitans changchengi]MBK4348117.1 preprotein translocase subunit YajC [Lacisediminihabitans changchengi]